MAVADYKEFTIAVGTNDPANTKYKVYNTYADFKCYVKHVPFRLFPEAKNVISQTWNDEDGDDEYIPNKVRYNAYEMEVDFVYAGNFGEANEDILRLIETISSKWLKIYDGYSQIGRQMVRFIGFKDDAKLYRRKGVNDGAGGKDYVEFSLKFKVNDPVTNIIL